MSFNVTACGLSDIGLVRQRNEDVWGQLPKQKIYILADGMGGHRSGDIAAKEAVSALTHLVDQMLNSLPPERNTLTEAGLCIRLAIEEVNRIVYHLGKTEEGLRGMGTTLCCVHVHDGGLIYAHVGDSRIYRLRQDRLVQLTEDHSLLRELVSSGQLEEQAAEDFLYKNIITKAIGTEPVVEPSVQQTEVYPGDTYLMCSDGLSDMLTTEEIEATIKGSASLEAASRALVSEAKDKGGHDNVTVVLIHVDTSDEKQHLPG